ncbi:putative Cyclophilin type peptidyl prolyl cis trans isomerase [Trypanosoma vivax]|uniref:Peptidyl-prolyl cis-trans isomerase n=1 Tax=Trypanosoma vivax (strain Y486) TaxID=1055687 RepID=G0U1B7_TRYVY|nr:putative cyclophilin-type peptidyl-prolyl cis-trans isomerase [Trypanosoma vivax]KAH8608894.1 putative Cyclophilin type peptidyl prolyl cis trans isomerase [Trypanosoma vivax]CCC49872.1 putative cyclophilin-type peptidyl-prolyl cis-trans isomerase [Trypanosoma vivax Y486]
MAASNMNLTAVNCLGATLKQGSRVSGSRYASHSEKYERTSCWMELACFNGFPEVPSLSGTLVQERCDLRASTRGAGEPQSLVRIEFELFDDESPKTCANFRQLCAGQSTSRQGQTYWFRGVSPCYRGTFFHKIVPHFCVQGGDITMHVDGGANHFSSFGRGHFADENKRRRMNEKGLLAMANNGPNTNGSQFFITTTDVDEKAFNSRHVCFGRIVRGLDEFMREVAPHGDSNGYPSRFVVVVDCGVGPLPGTFEGTGTIDAPVAAADPIPGENEVAPQSLVA